jgi:hypothetical protein
VTIYCHAVEQEARAEAKVITWAEESAFLLEEDVPTVLEQARSVARDEGVYLQLALQLPS